MEIPSDWEGELRCGLSVNVAVGLGCSNSLVYVRSLH